MPRTRWHLAVIEELIEGLDGFTRVTKIRTKTDKTNRPIAKLYPLEVSVVNETTTTPHTDDSNASDVQVSENVDHQDNDDQGESDTTSKQLTRNAAVKARDRIRGWTDLLSAAPEDVVDPN